MYFSHYVVVCPWFSVCACVCALFFLSLFCRYLQLCFRGVGRCKVFCALKVELMFCLQVFYVRLRSSVHHQGAA